MARKNSQSLHVWICLDHAHAHVHQIWQLGDFRALYTSDYRAVASPQAPEKAQVFMFTNVFKIKTTWSFVFVENVNLLPSVTFGSDSASRAFAGKAPESVCGGATKSAEISSSMSFSCRCFENKMKTCRSWLSLEFGCINDSRYKPSWWKQSSGWKLWPWHSWTLGGWKTYSRPNESSELELMATVGR